MYMGLYLLPNIEIENKFTQKVAQQCNTFLSLITQKHPATFQGSGRVFEHRILKY
jgi:hypothetical protein